MISVTTFHAAVPAPVFGTSLRQHEVRGFDSDRVFLLISAMGPPRLWGRALDAAAEGFAQGISRPHDGRMSSRLHQGFESARNLLKERTSMLIERRTADVSLLALGIDREVLHVLCVGPCRAFVRRTKRLRRLTPRDDRAEGLLHATPAVCAEPVSASDLVVCGSLSACTEAGLSAMHARIESDPKVTPETLVNTLNECALSRNLGAAALVLDIEEAHPVT